MYSLSKTSIYSNIPLFHLCPLYQMDKKSNVLFLLFSIIFTGLESLFYISSLILIVFWLLFTVLLSFVAETHAVKGSHRHHHGSTKLFVFGDSYADTGNSRNLFSSSWKEPYGITFPGKPTGRFSDGRVLTDYIGALSLSLSHTNTIVILNKNEYKLKDVTYNAFLLEILPTMEFNHLLFISYY